MAAVAARSDVEPRSPLRFLFLIDDHFGHITAASGLCERLLARGHEVHAVCPSARASARFAARGIDAEEAGWLASGLPDGGRGRRAARDALRDRLGAAEAGAAAIAAGRWDLVLIDPFLLWLYPWLRRRVRCASLCTKPDLEPDPLVPPWTSGLVPADTAIGRARVRAAWLRARWEYLRYRSRCAADELLRGTSHRMLARAALDAASHPRGDWACRPVAIDMRFRSVPEVIVHAREFDFPRRRWRADGPVYLGPCLPRALAAGAGAGAGAGAPLELPPGNGPLAYCTLGTEAKGTRRTERIGTVVEAIGSLPGWRALVATADPAATPAVAAGAARYGDRIRVVDWADGAAAMREATVVVNHGGANSTKEAIAAARPLLVLPQRADQPGIAARVAFHKLGLVGSDRGAAGIAADLRRLASDEAIGRSVRQMSELFADYDRHCVAERALERLARSR